MRFFELLNFQDVILYLFPALVFLLLFWAALAYSHFQTRGAEERKEKIYGAYVEGYETRNAPFPLSLTLIIAGAVIWSFLYILFVGLLGMRI